jgi:MazG family protein
MATRSFEDLIGLVARLRDAEDGCPWDRAQDHSSLRPYILEEAYELIAAIDRGDTDLLADELGDVLLQVLLHSQIAAERGTFTIDDVIASLSAKLVRRHPHVFGDASDDLPSIHRRWEEIKTLEGRGDVMLPILVRARKALSAAAKLRGITPDRVGEIGETDEEKSGARILREIAAAWETGLDPEIALVKALDRLRAAE